MGLCGAEEGLEGEVEPRGWIIGSFFTGHRTLYVGVRMPLVRPSHRHHRPHSQKHRKRDREKESAPAEQGDHCKSHCGVCWTLQGYVGLGSSASRAAGMVCVSSGSSEGKRRYSARAPFPKLFSVVRCTMALGASSSSGTGSRAARSG